MASRYTMTKPQTLIHITDIVTIHYYELDKNFVFSGEKHDFWEMVYVDKGSVAIQAEENHLILNQGEILFHKPNEFHSIRSYASDPNFFVISFACKSAAMCHFENYRATLSQSLRPFVSSIITEARNSFHIPKNDVNLTRLTRLSNAKAGSEQLIKLYMEQLLILLIRAIWERKENSVFPTKENTESQLIFSVKTYISNHLGSKITLDEISRITGYSKAHLCRSFLHQCGMTIGAYIASQKIRYAKELIRNHTYNFTQISDMLSFDTPQYFTSVFKRETGMTPSEFKRSLDIR